jgi:peptidoglycan hydrolase-like protein with peptidoglycan-binding domain
MKLTKKQLSRLIEGYLMEAFVQPYAVVDSSFIDRLESIKSGASSSLKRGEKSDDVKNLQNFIHYFGEKLPNYGSDSDFGRETRNAVKTFQNALGLDDDGIIGKNTAAGLLHILQKAKESGRDPVVDNAEEFEGPPEPPLDFSQTRSFAKSFPGAAAAKPTPKPSSDSYEIDLDKYDVTIARRRYPIFTTSGKQSHMTRSGAGDNMLKTLEMYRELQSRVSFLVPIVDGIAKKGTSRERETKNSQHFHGKALDLRIREMSDDQKIELVAAASEVGFTSMGFGYNKFHIDWRSRNSNGKFSSWDYGVSKFAGVSVRDLKRWVKNGGVRGGPLVDRKTGETIIDSKFMS